MTKLEQLQKQVAVLRAEVVAAASDDADVSHARDALAESDRIEAEPVEASDWETVFKWVVARRNRSLTLDADSLRLWEEDGNPMFEGGLPTAAAWVRAQGGGRG